MISEHAVCPGSNYTYVHYTSGLKKGCYAFEQIQRYLPKLHICLLHDYPVRYQEKLFQGGVKGSDRPDSHWVGEDGSWISELSLSAESCL